MRKGVLISGLLGCVVLLAVAHRASAATLEVMPSDTGSSAGSGHRRNLLAKIEVTNAALKLANTIMDPKFFQVLNAGTKKPKLTCPAGATGIITWDKADAKKHLIAEKYPTGAVVMSTGDAKLSIAAKYDAAADKANSSAPTKSDKIKDAYDLCVLDFWVKTKEDGSIYLNSHFATLEGTKDAAAKHAAGVKADDTFHIEVTDPTGEVWPISQVFEENTPVTWLNFKDVGDRQTTKLLPYPDYIPVDIRDFLFDKDAEYRIKFRIADVGDSLVDSAAFIQKAGFTMMPPDMI